MKALEDCEIVLGVCGGIAAYKSAVLCSNLVRLGANVTVIMTKNATRFVAPLTFSTLTGSKVYSDMWFDNEFYDTKHIEIAKRTRIAIIAPATANVIAKVANGICDDLLTTTICGMNCDVLFAPAMNKRMWNNPITQRNLNALCDYGYYFIGPDSGRLACREDGEGRMSEPDIILERTLELLHKL